MPYRPDRVLPGLEPGYIRLDLTREPEGFWTLTVYAVEGPGFVTAADGDCYPHLSYMEALDVASAALDGLGGVQVED